MSLKNKAVKGVAWNSIGSIGAGLINFIITIVLARILSPSDFGLIELLIVFTIISDAIVDSGFSQALIRDENADDIDFSSIFYLNITIATIIYIILVIASSYIANFYNAPQLKNLSIFVFLTTLINSFSIIQNTIFAKKLDFKTPAISSVVAIIVAGVISLSLAYFGFGVWAIATNLVLNSFIRMIFFWIQSTWRPVAKFSFESIRKYFAFGGNLLLQGLLDKIVSNLESLIIGRVYSKESLGYFSQARKFNSYINQTSISVIQRVTYPVLAKIKNEKSQLKLGYKRVLGVTMFIMIPVMFFISATSENFMHVFFGAKWVPASQYLRLWSVTGLIVSFYSIFINIFLVLGKSRFLLKISIIRQVIRIFAIILFIRISIMSLMWSILIVTIIFAFIYVYFAGRLISYSLKEVAMDMFQLIIVGFLSAISSFILGKLLLNYNFYFVFIMQGFIMFFIYLFFLSLMKNKYFIEIREIAISAIKKNRK